tara:strand:- start:13702 stop:14490 length:789 start_codon:yes stop_codon:yes gene_type:complete
MELLVRDESRGVEIQALVEGAGPDVVLIASALRGAEDFAGVQAALTAGGFRSLAINMRGAGKSTGPGEGLTLRDVADDVALVIERECGGRAHVVGHALGNIVARATASYRPDVVRTVTAMPGGGHNLAKYATPPEVLRHFSRCHDLSLPKAERIESLQVAFFAPVSDPSCWLDGWWPSARAVSQAAQQAAPEEWWRAGDVPILIVHPRDDAFSPRSASRETAEALGERATFVELPDCGHALLPEAPGPVAENLIRFFRAQEQ